MARVRAAFLRMTGRWELCVAMRSRSGIWGHGGARHEGVGE